MKNSFWVRRPYVDLGDLQLFFESLERVQEVVDVVVVDLQVRARQRELALGVQVDLPEYVADAHHYQPVALLEVALEGLRQVDLFVQQPLQPRQAPLPLRHVLHRRQRGLLPHHREGLAAAGRPVGEHSPVDAVEALLDDPLDELLVDLGRHDLRAECVAWVRQAYRR